MEPTLSGFALGLLFGAAKTLLITTAVFGVAWWRGRRRIESLEAEVGRPSLDAERLDRLEQSVEYMISQLDRLSAGQRTSALSSGSDTSSDRNESR